METNRKKTTYQKKKESLKRQDDDLVSNVSTKDDELNCYDSQDKLCRNNIPTVSTQYQLVQQFEPSHQLKNSIYCCIQLDDKSIELDVLQFQNTKKQIELVLEEKQELQYLDRLCVVVVMIRRILDMMQQVQNAKQLKDNQKIRFQSSKQKMQQLLDHYVQEYQNRR